MSDKASALWAWLKWGLVVIGVALLGIGVFVARDAIRGLVIGKSNRWIKDPSDPHSIIVETGDIPAKVTLPPDITSDQVSAVAVSSSPESTVTVEALHVPKDRKHPSPPPANGSKG